MTGKLVTLEVINGAPTEIKGELRLIMRNDRCIMIETGNSGKLTLSDIVYLSRNLEHYIDQLFEASDKEDLLPDDAS